jgi:hypothetical protein
MKKITLIILWVVAAYLASFGIAVLANKATHAYATHQIESLHHAPSFNFQNLEHLWMWLFPVAFPILAIIFGLRGKLPGTCNKK